MCSRHGSSRIPYPSDQDAHRHRCGSYHIHGAIHRGRSRYGMRYTPALHAPPVMKSPSVTSDRNSRLTSQIRGDNSRSLRHCHLYERRLLRGRNCSRCRRGP